MTSMGSDNASLEMDASQNPEDTLQVWLDRLHSVDPADFDEVRGELISRASYRLETLARRMLRNYPRLRRWEQTGDVLQNSLLRLHHALSTIRPETPRGFFGLAATQIRRELIDLTRHHFGPEGEGANHQTDHFNDSAGRQGGLLNQAEVRQEPASLEEWTEFHEAVEKLPPVEREVFDLYWYEGLDQKAIATLLQITDRTVKNRWRSAKLLLQAMLQDNHRRD